VPSARPIFDTDFFINDFTPCENVPNLRFSIDFVFFFHGLKPVATIFFEATPLSVEKEFWCAQVIL